MYYFGALPPPGGNFCANKNAMQQASAPSPIHPSHLSWNLHHVVTALEHGSQRSLVSKLNEAPACRMRSTNAVLLAPDDRSIGDQVVDECQRMFAGHRVRIQRGQIRKTQQDRDINLGQIDLAHGPAGVTTFVDLFVVQQHHIGVARIGDDLGVKPVDGIATAFEHLHIHSLAMAKNASDTFMRIMNMRLLHDVIQIATLIFTDGATGVQESN